MPTPCLTGVKRTSTKLTRTNYKRTNPHRLVQRAQIVLLATEGMDNTAISKQVNLHRHQVRRWRHRWQESVDRLNCVEQAGLSDEALLGQIISVLSDEARTGGPAILGWSRLSRLSRLLVNCLQAVVVNLALDAEELASEVVKRGIVASISLGCGAFFKGSHTPTSPPLLAQ